MEPDGEAIAMITYGALAEILGFPEGVEICAVHVPGPNDVPRTLMLHVRGPSLPEWYEGEIVRHVMPQYSHETRLVFRDWGT